MWLKNNKRIPLPLVVVLGDVATETDSGKISDAKEADQMSSLYRRKKEGELRRAEADFLVMGT